MNSATIPRVTDGSMTLTAAKHRFFQAYSVERRLLEYHRKLLWSEITQAIDNRDRRVEYEVPVMLTGAWPVYHVDEVVVYLLRELRVGGLSRQLISRHPHVIRVWGWAEEIEREERRRCERLRDAAEAPPPAAAAGRGRGAPPPAAVSMHEVKSGALSERLRRRAAHFEDRYGATGAHHRHRRR